MTPANALNGKSVIPTLVRENAPPPGLLQEADRKQFQEDGVVCLRGVISASDIEDLRAAADRMASEVSTSITGYNVTALVDGLTSQQEGAFDGETGEQYALGAIAEHLRAKGAKPLVDPIAVDSDRKGSFLLDTSTWMRDAAIRRLALDGSLPELAAHLMGATKVNYYDDQIFIKEPYTEQRTAFHQDYGYFKLEGWNGCVMWIPFDPVDQERGAVQYIRGSHQWGDIYRPNWFFCQDAFDGSQGTDLPDIEGTIDNYDVVSFDVMPGDVIVHHFRTVHGAGGNRSPYPRRALSLRYCGEDMRFFDRPGTAPQPHHHHQLRDGDLLDSQQFPVVWPRPYPNFKLSSYYGELFGQVGQAA